MGNTASFLGLGQVVGGPTPKERLEKARVMEVIDPPTVIRTIQQRINRNDERTRSVQGQTEIAVGQTFAPKPIYHPGTSDDYMRDHTDTPAGFSPSRRGGSGMMAQGFNPPTGGDPKIKY